MKRVGLTVLVFVLGLQLVTPSGAEAQQAPPGGATALTFDPFDVKSVNIPHFGGSSIIGGFYGGHQGECGVGTEAYLERRNADGTLAWRRCHHSSPEGRCAELGGLPLFAELTSIDPAYIVASSLHAADVGGGGKIVVTGEVFAACQQGPDIAVSRGAFLALFNGEGDVIADTYVGDLPNCPPIDDDICCRDLCDDGWFPPGGGGGDGSCGGRGITMEASGIAFTGWCSPTGGTAGRDVAVGRFTNSLNRHWLFQAGLPDKDVGLDVAMDNQGNVFAIGFATLNARHRDAFVSKHAAATGQLLDALLDGGANDDEGREITIEANGDLAITGFVTDEATLGGQTIGSPGAGRQQFTATLDSNQLQLMELEMGATAAINPVGLPLEPLPPSHPFTISDCTILIGTSGGGCAEVLEHAGDGSTLNLTALEDAAGKTAIEIEVDLLPAQWPFELQSLGVKVEADFCYTATVWLNGLLDDVNVELGQQEICPAEEPRLVADIPRDLSHLLGFDGLSLPVLGEVLKVILRFDFGVTCPPSLACDSQIQVASVDEIDVEVEF